MRPLLLGLSVALLFVAACDPCAGTASCHTQPELSYTGQFIEFPSGKAMAGVKVAFARRSGALLVTDTVRAVSSGDGFFVLRANAFGDGETEGALIVTPSMPYTPYTVRRLRLSTHRTRGDGGFLGRLMVNPYLQFIAELHDRKTLAQVPGATVTIRQFGPGRVAPATTQVVSAENGRFMWEPKVIDFDDLDVEFEVSASGYPRSYHLRDTLSLQYRDEPPKFVVLVVGGGWSYAGQAIRRGTRQYLSGVSIEFVRTGGIQAQPDRFIVSPDQNGMFGIPMEPVGDGTLIGDLTVRPPAPLPVETIRNITLTTFDGGKVKLLGPFGYGAGAIARPVLLYRATGLPVKEGTWARFTHVGGLQDIIPAPWTVPDNGIRIVDSTGTVGYDAGTFDAGDVSYDIEVRLNEPHDWETLRSVSVPARYSDTPAIDTFRVGSWFPWTGELRDADTGTPVVGASVEFKRTTGASVRPEVFTVVSGADGTFPIRPEPLSRGPVDAQITVRSGGVYQDATVSVRIQPAQDDILRTIGVIKLTRVQP